MRRPHLTYWQERELLDGPGERPAFRSEDDRRQVWERYRGELLMLMVEGCRPWAARYYEPEGDCRGRAEVV